MEEELKYFNNCLSVTKRVIKKNEDEINEAKKDIVKSKRYLYENQREIGDADLFESFDNEDRRVIDLNKKIRKNISLYHSLENPYFARIDVKGYEDLDKLYIGLTSIQDDNDFLVYDWRAPISNLYYNYGLGNVKFNGEDIEVTLKRQYQIKMGKLLNFVDTSAAIDDELLRDALIKSPTDKMQNIVSTIQKEQNEIIRYNGNENLVIEGVAGSGKTAIILHRVAYLLYNTKDLTSKNVVIISPNEEFSNYISGVLPELGEENIRSLSLDILLRSLTKKEVESQGEFINRSQKEEITYIPKEKLDNYLEEYSNNLEFKNGFALDKTVIKYTDLNDILKNKAKKLNIANKVEYTASRVLELLNKNEDKNIDKMKSMIKKLLNISDDPIEIYKDFISKCGIDKSLDSISYEDVAPILYLYYEINGYPEYAYIKHLVIDESQDYTPFEFRLLRKIFNSSIFTIVGDENQRLNKYVLYELPYIANIINNTKYIKLSKTYRSSEEITDYTNNILGINNVKSIRGKNGIDVKVKNTNNIYDSILSDLEEFSKHEFKVNAIITVDEDSASKIKEKLGNKKLINTKVLPYYLAKGLEFEGVIIYDKDNYFKNNKNTFYVASTRAREALVIYN